MLLLEDLADENMELVTSSFTQPYIESMSTLSPLAQSKLTELLTINNIHNYLTPAGPYHPAIEELRENSYLDYFRKWISTDHSNLSLPEIRDIKESVEQEIQRAQDEVFLKHLEPKGHYVSVGKAVVGDVLGLVIPGAGIAMSAFEEVVKFRGKKDTRWQGFVVSARSSARSKK